MVVLLRTLRMNPMCGYMTLIVTTAKMAVDSMALSSKLHNKRNKRSYGCCALVRVHPHHNDSAPTGEDLS